MKFSRHIFINQWNIGKIGNPSKTFTVFISNSYFMLFADIRTISRTSNIVPFFQRIWSSEPSHFYTSLGSKVVWFFGSPIRVSDIRFCTVNPLKFCVNTISSHPNERTHHWSMLMCTNKIWWYSRILLSVSLLRSQELSRKIIYY